MYQLHSEGIGLSMAQPAAPERPCERDGLAGVTHSLQKAPISHRRHVQVKQEPTGPQ